MTTKHPEIFLVPESKHQISCDGSGADKNGAGAALGHPKVYYTFDGLEEVICGYCDRLFTKKPVPGAKPLKSAHG